MEGTKTTFIFKVKNLINGFIYGFYFPLAICTWALICFYFNFQDVGLFVLICIAGLILVVHRDITPIVPILTCFFLLIRDYAPLTSLPYVVSYIFLFSCIICHFITFPPKVFCVGKLFFPLCLITAALFLGGTLSPYVTNYKNGLVPAFAMGPMVLLIYLIFLNGITPPEKLDLKVYLATAIIIPTVFAAFEHILIKTCTSLELFKARESMGWGNFNTFGAMVLLAVPMCAYLIAKSGKFIAFFSVIVFLIAADFLAHSDGSTGIVLMSLPFLALFVLLNSKRKNKRKIFIFIVCLILLVSSAALAIVNIFTFDEILNFIIIKTNNNGRLRIYKKAIELFKKNPVLGVGISFVDEASYIITNNMFNFHSTFFHVLATMGICGIIAYAVYIMSQVKVLLSGHSSFVPFAFTSFVLFQGYGIIDICQFNLIPLVCYATLLVLVSELEKLKADDKNLPLNYKYKLNNF